MSIDALIADLEQELGAGRARAEPLELALYARDAGAASGRAAAVCFPQTGAEVAAAVRIAARHDRPFVARGSGTGLAGGATPVGDPLVIVTTQLNRVLDVDAEERVAWVEPGVLNLDLSREVRHLGLHYAPDPSSQQACTIGGNVATNAGGPHCLASGVTAAHVLAIEVVLGDGSVTMLGGLEPDVAGYDLRGCFVGSEGTMGIATRIAVRLTPNPPAVRTLLVDFTSVDAAGATVSDVIAEGVVPAALEMMDAEITRAVEDFVGAGYPRDAAAVLLVEIDGLPAIVDEQVRIVSDVARRHGARNVRVAADDRERDLLWKGRKSAFGAIARVAPDYYLHDAVVPRTKLVEVLRQVDAIATEHQLTIMNVFHAGDGNLHPIIVFDAREPGIWERVHRAGDEILAVCVAAGGVLSGEHGIGLEKREAMPLVFSIDDLDAQARRRDAFDPAGRANPTKVLPAGSRCGELQRIPDGAWV
ncbi:MAG: FAD-linked oxidase C-terminal domain-containing protein [Acidimicrobiia bacterium]